MRHHVYFFDGYQDDGCHGFQSFETEPEALAFINGRITDNPDGLKPERYFLIEGVIKPLEVQSIAVRLKIKAA